MTHSARGSGSPPARPSAGSAPPEDVAEAVYAVAHAAYTTGEVVRVDGGRHLV
ncbi:hypothetical protein [Streptomyces sp. CB02959]|uniref:hypothetical protein n=1 Tax=Streptomyces sp. CB02959 TaxID=2020330 RepID=UPI0015E0C413|nr:hypothetical protein [Streptomyces sp. CB02959]